GSWWGWSQAKEIMEWLFWTGEVSTSERRNFERRYDLTERIIPGEIYRQSTPSKADAQRALMELAARAVGVGTLRDLRDYFRLPTADANERLRELVEEGTLTPLRVEGWKQQAYVHRDVRVPKQTEQRALLSPFDSLIWERDRTERLFNFAYRLEIYTPAHKRKHGYYVLPFLLNGEIVGRIDLKSNRSDSVLEVRGGSLEPSANIEKVLPDLQQALNDLAEWLGLEDVRVKSRRGELMRALTARRRNAARARAKSA
ncbi:MAG TPA: crosslink repair DNA glycosylase YcaQ family protein, partial [Steroidobacteraceae bacterium]|nr:crosslink repair DNA glycosylase YcaQ family protein [Steroidobacteraceae bacterium]